MNTKKKKNIIEVLFEKNLCFAVCAFSNRSINKGLKVRSTDYAIIINQSDAELVESNYTFNQTDNYKQVFERNLSPDDVEVLKEYKDRFVKIKHNEYGRVYELKGNSFKDSYDNNKRLIQNEIVNVT